MPGVLVSLYLQTHLHFAPAHANRTVAKVAFEKNEHYKVHQILSVEINWKERKSIQWFYELVIEKEYHSL